MILKIIIELQIGFRKERKRNIFGNESGNDNMLQVQNTSCHSHRKLMIYLLKGTSAKSNGDFFFFFAILMHMIFKKTMYNTRVRAEIQKNFHQNRTEIRRLFLNFVV